MEKSQSVSSRLTAGLSHLGLTGLVCLGLTGLVCLAACGGISQDTNEPPPTGEGAGDVGEEAPVNLNSPTGNTAVVLGTDFTVGTVNLVSINEPHEATLNVSTTHSDAVARAYGGKVYVVNRLGADNVEVIDPAGGFSTPTLQFSTGNGTNPQDIIVTEPNKAFISLYQPDDNSSTDLAVDDVLIVDPTTGTISGTIDLTPLTADDGERIPRASDMVIVDDKIFVAVQDLTSFFSADQAGKIAVIDAETNALTGSITLTGRNPFAMTYSPETGLIYAVDADFADTSSANGGVEVIDPVTLTSRGIFVDDLNLGGAATDIEVSGLKGYLVIGFVDENGNFVTKVDSFDLDPNQAANPTEIYRSAGSIQDIAIDENGNLVIGDQDPTISGLVFVDTNTNTRIGDPVTVGGSPMSITFVDR